MHVALPRQHRPQPRPLGIVLELGQSNDSEHRIHCAYTVLDCSDKRATVIIIFPSLLLGAATIAPSSNRYGRIAGTIDVHCCGFESTRV